MESMPFGSALILALVAPLMLTVRSITIPNTSVPRGAQRVPLLTISLSASCAGVATVSGIRVTHRGMGDQSEISAVYAMARGKRISRGRQFSSSDGQLLLPLRPALVIPACQTTDVTIAADFSAEALAASEHTLLLLRPGDIEAGSASVRILSPDTASATGDRDRRGSVIQTAGSAQGSVAVNFLPLLTRIRYGDGRTVARMTLSASDFDQFVSAMTLTNDGSARDHDLQNLTLVTQRGVVLARTPALDGELVPFTLDPPFLLPRGETMRLDVRADVRASIRRTVGLSLEEPSDLTATRARIRR